MSLSNEGRVTIWDLGPWGRKLFQKFKSASQASNNVLESVTIANVIPVAARSSDRRSAFAPVDVSPLSDTMREPRFTSSIRRATLVFASTKARINTISHRKRLRRGYATYPPKALTCGRFNSATKRTGLPSPMHFFIIVSFEVDRAYSIFTSRCGPSNLSDLQL